MSWNYRILRHPNGDLALHEVFYDDTGPTDTTNIKGYTQQPISFVVSADEGLDGLLASLRYAIADAEKHPVLSMEDLNTYFHPWGKP